MKLDGSLSQNLKAAIRSADNLRASSVHEDTLQFWRDLIGHARAECGNVGPEARNEVEQLIDQLQNRLSLREQH
ncbi:hypothetical protein [Sphingosinicella sp. CPCC 101087]|uniref:hypothetical protein n=1 Tax=Sphingosinicella sp. CPCC 101087 TaxID=2497754 RepID=UPI00101C17D4|nr:hypothetical protein [Sphingosinicella sp. CPCC 101087]